MAIGGKLSPTHEAPYRGLRVLDFGQGIASPYAAMLLGVAESLTATFYGPSWAPAVSFGLLLLTLAFRPSGLMGRA